MFVRIETFGFQCSICSFSNENNSKGDLYCHCSNLIPIYNNNLNIFLITCKHLGSSIFIEYRVSHLSIKQVVMIVKPYDTENMHHFVHQVAKCLTVSCLDHLSTPSHTRLGLTSPYCFVNVNIIFFVGTWYKSGL